MGTRGKGAFVVQTVQSWVNKNQGEERVCLQQSASAAAMAHCVPAAVKLSERSKTKGCCEKHMFIAIVQCSAHKYAMITISIHLNVIIKCYIK